MEAAALVVLVVTTPRLLLCGASVGDRIGRGKRAKISAIRCCSSLMRFCPRGR